MDALRTVVGTMSWCKDACTHHHRWRAIWISALAAVTVSAGSVLATGMVVRAQAPASGARTQAPAGDARHAPANAGDSTLFVAEGGDDANNDCLAEATPCLTITHALDVASPGATTINVSGTIVDSNISPSPTVSPITITQTPGGSPAVITANGAGRVFMLGTGVNDSSGLQVTLDHLTIENGTGGGIVNTNADVTITNSTITNNTGGGIVNGATVGSVITGEFAPLTITNSTIANNSNTGSGGGIALSGPNANIQGPVTITDSTIADNAGFSGGGLLNAGAPVTITNSTFTGNRATGSQGGAINLFSTGTAGFMSIFASTITGNSSQAAGGGIRNGNLGGLFAIGASIVARNTAGVGFSNPNCLTPMVSLGFNLTDDATGAACFGSTIQPTDVLGENPMLGSLQDNGGPTQTLLPAPSSPAVGRITNPTTVTAPSNFATPPPSATVCGPGATDQRGFLRPFPPATACTIGAVEVTAPPVITSFSPISGSTSGGTTVTVNGSGFVPGTTVTVGGGAAIRPESIAEDGTSLTFVTPPHAAGAAVVTVMNVAGTSNGVQFAFVAPAPAPMINTISPNSGPTAGGTEVTLTGSGFVTGTTVSVNNVSGIVPTLITPTSITFVTRPHDAGTVDVTVANDNGTSNAVPFTFEAPPVINTISPNSGPTAGGTKVALTGSGFVAGTTVSVGGGAAITPDSIAEDGTSLTFTTPAHAAGTVDVRVTNANGTSNSKTFTFEASPSPSPSTSPTETPTPTETATPTKTPTVPAVVAPASAAPTPGLPVTGIDHTLGGAVGPGLAALGGLVLVLLLFLGQWGWRRRRQG